MKLDYYKSGKSSGKRTAELDYAGLLKVLEEPRLRTICDAFRGGDAEAKKNLPWKSAARSATLKASHLSRRSVR